jgi:hypothetical protein
MEKYEFNLNELNSLNTRFKGYLFMEDYAVQNEMLKKFIKVKSCNLYLLSSYSRRYFNLESECLCLQ